MAYTVPANGYMAIFITKRGKVVGVAERRAAGAETLSNWAPVTDEPIDTNPVPDKVRDFEPITFLRSSDTALAPPADSEAELLGSNCYYVIQGGRAYRVCG